MRPVAWPEWRTLISLEGRQGTFDADMLLWMQGVKAGRQHGADFRDYIFNRVGARVVVQGFLTWLCWGESTSWWHLVGERVS